MGTFYETTNLQIQSLDREYSATAVIDRPEGLPEQTREALWDFRRERYYALIEGLLVGSNSVLLYDEELICMSAAALKIERLARIGAGASDVKQLMDPPGMKAGSLRLCTTTSWRSASWPDPMYMSGFLAGMRKNPDEVHRMHGRLVHELGESWARQAFWQLSSGQFDKKPVTALLDNSQFVVFVTGLQGWAMSFLNVLAPVESDKIGTVIRFLRDEFQAEIYSRSLADLPTPGNPQTPDL